MALNVTILREAFRNIQQWRVLYEETGIDTLTFDNDELSLWDIEYLIAQLWRLPLRQGQSIQSCLIDNLTERGAAIAMGCDPENPVAVYATNGIVKLLALIEAGELPLFKSRVEIPTNHRGRSIRSSLRKEAERRKATADYPLPPPVYIPAEQLPTILPRPDEFPLVPTNMLAERNGVKIRIVVPSVEVISQPVRMVG